MPNFTIYVTGGVEWFYATLNAVAMFFNDGDLIWAVALMGALFAIITGAWFYIQKNLGSGLLRTHTWIEHAVMMAIALAIGFVPTRVTIQNIYGDMNATPVDNVPLVLSLPAAIFSGVSYEVFNAFDTAFQSTSGSYMSVSDQGFATPLKLLFAMRGGLEKTSNDLAASFQYYLVDCTKNSAINSRGIATSPALFQYLIDNGRDTGLTRTLIDSSGSPTGGTSSLSTPVPVSCAQAKVLLQQRFDVFENGSGAGDSDVNRLINYNVRAADHGASAGTGGYTYASYQDSFNHLLGFTGQSAQQFMRTALIRNLVNDTYRCANSAYSEAAFTNCTQIQNDAMEAYKVDAAAGANLFTKTMFPAMTLLQLMFFAFGVIIFLYGLLKGAGVVMYLAKYFVFGLWVFSWLPCVAVINAFIQWMVEDKIQQLPAAGLTSENYATYMYDVLSTNLATASDMLAATPLLTLGILTGSAYAIAGVANRLSARDYVDESQAAPRTGTVQPMVQTTPLQTSNQYTGLQSSDFETPKFSVSDALHHVEESAHAQSIASQVSQMRAAERFVGASVQEIGGGSWTAVDGRTYSLQNMNSFEEAEKVAMQVAQQRGYSADTRAEIGAGFKKLALGVSAAEVYRNTESADAREALSRGIDAGTRYAENYVAQANDQYAARGGTLSEDVRRASDTYQDQRQRATQDRAEWRSVASRSRDASLSKPIAAPAFGQALAEDEVKGTAGHGWTHRISDRFAQLGREFSPDTLRAQKSRQLDYLTRNGKTQLPEQDTIAEFLAVRTFDQKFGSEILGEIVAAPAISADYDSNAGIGHAAQGVGVSAEGLGISVPSAVAQTGATHGIAAATDMQDRVAVTDDIAAGGAGIRGGLDQARDEQNAQVSRTGGRQSLTNIDTAADQTERTWLTHQQQERIKGRGKALATHAEDGSESFISAVIGTPHAMAQDAAQTIVTDHEAMGRARSAAAKEKFGADISQGRPPEKYIPKATLQKDGSIQYYKNPDENEGGKDES